MSGDLHCHTKLSDGTLGLEEIIALAAKKGIETIGCYPYNAFIVLQCDNFELKATPTSITNDECEILKNLFNEGVWVE